MADRVRIPDHVVHRAFEAETVLLNLDTGRYHGLNATAARMFEVLAETGSKDEAARVVAEEYGQSLERTTADVDELCADLVERGLVEIDAGGG